MRSSWDYCSNLNLRHVNDHTEVVDLSVNFQRLRAFYLVGGIFGNTSMKNIRRLRVLILAGRNIKELPSSIGELKYLRYLDVSRTSISMLPDSITKLYNLKKLRHVYGHLHIPRMGKLANLQTPPYIIVNGEEGYNMKELETLDNLKGKIIIYEIQNVADKKEASTSDLSRKFPISNLELHWQFNQKFNCDPQEILISHSNLRVLSIRGFNGHNFPSWIILSKHMYLHKLVQIQLEGCDRCVEIPALGHLPNLQQIEILMDSVKCIGTEFYGLNELDSTSAVFPSLKKLSLNMLNLEKWIGVRNSSLSLPRPVFPRLQELILNICINLTELPEIDFLNSLKLLTIYGCYKLASLPSWIQGLESIQDITLSQTSLNYLPEMKPGFSSKNDR